MVEEDVELICLLVELLDLGFLMVDFRDFDYVLFVCKMVEYWKFCKLMFSFEEWVEQEKVVDEIIDEILCEEDVK